jgi:hypothetical protein
MAASRVKTIMIDKVKEKPKHDSGSQQYALMKAIGFNEDDLHANTEGYMSKKQRAMLSKNRKAWLKRISGVIVIVSILFISALLNGIKGTYRFADAVMLIAGSCLLAALVMLYMWLRRSRLNADLHKGDVYIAEGSISLHVQKIQDGKIVINLYHADIQDQRFKLDKAIFDVFKNYDHYTIYYAPHSKTILSAEWLREG